MHQGTGAKEGGPVAQSSLQTRTQWACGAGSSPMRLPEFLFVIAHGEWSSCLRETF